MAGAIEPIGRMALLFARKGRIFPTIAAQIVRTSSSSTPSKPAPSKPAPSKPAPSKSKQQELTIKRLRKENKDIFGELLESKYDKIKREKKKKKSDAKEMKKSTELINNNEELLSKIQEDNVGKQSEINWALKSNPQRSKIIKRSLPEFTVHSFDAIKGPSGQSKIFVGGRDELPHSTRLSEREMRALPTMKQVDNSFQVCLDILPSFETKIVRKGGNVNVTSKTTTKNGRQQLQSSPDNFPKATNGQEEDTGFVESEKEEIFNENEKTFSHDEGDKSSLSASTDSPMDSFPYDNPEKTTGNADLDSSDQIISLPFPKTIRNSHGNGSTEESQPRIPSVSRILNATMPPEQVAILKRWEEKMIAKLGELGFQRYKEDLFAGGKKIHANIQSLLGGKTAKDDLVIDENISGHWESLQSIFPKIERVHVLESHVFHPQLNYCGIVDCVARFGDKLVVIDWKTSEKPKPVLSMTYDTPLQISAYIGALNYDPNYSLKIHAGLIVVAYKDGTDCQTHFLNSSQIDGYWKQWLQRLKLYSNLPSPG